jgi:hypothetical protein
VVSLCVHTRLFSCFKDYFDLPRAFNECLCFRMFFFIMITVIFEAAAKTLEVFEYVKFTTLSTVYLSHILYIISFSVTLKDFSRMRHT